MLADKRQIKYKTTTAPNIKYKTMILYESLVTFYFSRDLQAFTLVFFSAKLQTYDRICQTLNTKQILFYLAKGHHNHDIFNIADRQR